MIWYSVLWDLNYYFGESMVYYIRHAFSTCTGSCKRLVVDWSSCMTWSFLQLSEGSVTLEVFWEGKYLLGIFAEKLIWQVWAYLKSFLRKKMFLNIFSQKLTSYDFVLPLCCTKWRRPLGGSRWKFLELQHVSRFLACVTARQRWWYSMKTNGTCCLVFILNWLKGNIMAEGEDIVVRCWQWVRVWWQDWCYIGIHTKIGKQCRMNLEWK